MKILGCFVVALALLVFVGWLVVHFVGLPVAIGVVLLGLIAVKLALSKLGKAVKEFTNDITPDRKTISLPAGQRFEGMAFAWTFPVACQIEQTVIADFETLLIKPALDLWEGAPEVGLTAATMSIEEMKQGTEEKTKDVLSVIQDLSTDGFVPVEVGPYSGEGKFIEAPSESGPVKGEFIYLGDENFSIAWSVITLADRFQPLADQFRQLASLIERIEPVKTESQSPDIP